MPVRQEAAAQVTAEEVQAVVESAEHAHQRSGHFHRELEMLRRVEDQRRVKNGEAERSEDLNEEQRGRSLRSRGEKAFERLHPVGISLADPADVKPLSVLAPRSHSPPTMRQIRRMERLG